MTVNQAKRIVRNRAELFGLKYGKITARTVSFQDLARASCIFVSVHSPEPSPRWEEISEDVRCWGFCIEFH